MSKLGWTEEDAKHIWWRPKKGPAITLHKMSDTHLVNAYAHMVRRRTNVEAELHACYSCTFQGEQAQYAQDVAAKQLAEQLADNSYWESVLRLEAERRQLPLDILLAPLEG